MESLQTRKCLYCIYATCNLKCGRTHPNYTFTEKQTRIREFIKERKYCVAHMLFGKCSHMNKRKYHLTKAEILREYNNSINQSASACPNDEPLKRKHDDYAGSASIIEQKIAELQAQVNDLRTTLERQIAESKGLTIQHPKPIEIPDEKSSEAGIDTEELKKIYEGKLPGMSDETDPPEVQKRHGDEVREMHQCFGEMISYEEETITHDPPDIKWMLEDYEYESPYYSDDDEYYY